MTSKPLLYPLLLAILVCILAVAALDITGAINKRGLSQDAEWASQRIRVGDSVEDALALLTQRHLLCRDITAHSRWVVQFDRTFACSRFRMTTPFTRMLVRVVFADKDGVIVGIGVNLQSASL